MPRSSATTRFSPHPAASSLYFDGSGDVVTMGNVFVKERTDAFSISAWCWLGAFNAVGSVVAAKYSTARGYFWGIFATTGKMRFFLRNTAATNEISVSTDDIFPRRQWVHCVVTYDGSSTAAGVKIYWNGVLKTQTALVDNLSATIVDSAVFSIGAFDPSTQPWVGLLTDVRLHNAVLSLAQINDLYLKNNAVSVEAYWPFTDGSGATLTETVAAVNGTITGAAWKTGVPGVFIVGSGRPIATTRSTATIRTAIA